MYARITTFKGSTEDIEAAVGVYREEVIPWLRDATGFRGWIVLLDREQGRSRGLTFWATEEAARDQEASGGGLRDELVARTDTTMESLEIYEVVVAEALAFGEA